MRSIVEDFSKIVLKLGVSQRMHLTKKDALSRTKATSGYFWIWYTSIALALAVVALALIAVALTHATALHLR